MSYEPTKLASRDNFLFCFTNRAAVQMVRSSSIQLRSRAACSTTADYDGAPCVAGRRPSRHRGSACPRLVVVLTTRCIDGVRGIGRVVELPLVGVPSCAPSMQGAVGFHNTPWTGRHLRIRRQREICTFIHGRRTRFPIASFFRYSFCLHSLSQRILLRRCCGGVLVVASFVLGFYILKFGG